MSDSAVVRMKPLKNVSISGGTHGNELIGVYLVKHWMDNNALVQRDSFKTHLTLSNLQAIEKCVRYIDVDLNRQFTKEPIVPKDHIYETQRASEIQKWTTANNVDFTVDLHNTTSNMGTSLLLGTSSSTNAVCLQIAAHIKESFDFPVKILIFKSDNSSKEVKGSFVGGGFTDLSGCGIGLEVGPLSHGTLDAHLFHQTAKVVSKILNLIDRFNNGEEFVAREVETFQTLARFGYPLDANGNITAMVHSDLNGKDWEPLKKGDPMFMTLDGQNVTYEKDEVIWPTFINEAAYVEKNVAFVATKKVNLKLQAVKKS